MTPAARRPDENRCAFVCILGGIAALPRDVFALDFQPAQTRSLAAMPAASELTAAFLDKAKGVLVSTHGLNAGLWDSARAEAHQDDLASLADYAGNLGLDQVQAAVFDLYAYISVFTEGTLHPNPAQRQELARLIEQAQGVVMSLAANGAADADALVYLLLPSGDPPVTLDAALRQEGLQLRVFQDGDLLANALRLRMPHLILAEAGLVAAVTEMLDGLSATQVPLVAVNDGDPNSRVQSLVDGADLYLENLADTGVAAHLRELFSSQAVAPYRVLVVDDDRQMGTYCESILGRAGMQVQSTQQAADVLQRVRDFKPDLVLMDLYLPGVDGLTLTTQLRQQADAVVLPIVFLSGEHNEEARFRAIQAGGDDFLTKPIRPRHLVAAVRSRIKRVRTLSRQLSRQPGDAHGHMRRGAFLEHLRGLLREPPADPVALLVVDVDQADELQERLSLSSGHELEQAVAWRLARHFAPGDRYGLIQEFGFGLAISRAQRTDLLAFAGELCRSVADQPFKVDGEDRKLSVSVGLALMPASDGGVDPWINAAFAAARAAARLGGNRVEGLLGDGIDGLNPERVLRIRELLRVVADRRVLAIEYQPVIPLRGSGTGRYVAQVRLRDRREAVGGIERREFVPVARAAGTQRLIDRDVLQRTLQALEDQRTRNRVNDLIVPVDFACMDAEQVGWIAAEWQRTRHADRSLTLEFDGALLLETTQAARTLARLQAQGLRLGAWLPGPNQLPELQRLPLHLVRMPAATTLALTPELLDPIVGNWSRGGRSLIVDDLHDLTAVARLWSLSVDYLMGDAVAAPGPRLDFDFSEINLG